MPNSFKDLISVIIPLRNEEENVAPLLKQLYISLENIQYELLLIDDGSSDNTVYEVNQSKNDKTNLIQLAENYGQSAAIKAGLDYSKNDIIVILDGDLQNDPLDIPRMIKVLVEKDLDFVQGYRKNRHDNQVKKIPSSAANWLIRKVFNFPIHDIGCALKIFRKDALKNIYYFNGFHRYLSLLVHNNGFKVSEIEVIHHPRVHGKSKYGLNRFKQVIYDLWMVKSKKTNQLKTLEYKIKKLP